MLLVAAILAQSLVAPPPRELRAAYARANALPGLVRGTVLNDRLAPHWTKGGVWVRVSLPGGESEYLFADAQGAIAPAFDAAALAKALEPIVGAPVDPRKLPISVDSIASGVVTFRYRSTVYVFDGTLRRAPRPADAPASPPARPVPERSEARIRDGQVEVRAGEGPWRAATSAGGFETFQRAPDGRHFLALRCLPGDRKEVYLLHSTGLDKTRSTLETIRYDQPGDNLDTYESWLIDGEAATAQKLDVEPIMGSAYPYHSPPDVSIWQSRFILSFPVRGYQEYKVLAVDPATGTISTLVDERSSTFVDVSRVLFRPLADGRFLWASERDGWNRLYLCDGQTGAVLDAVTPPGCVFRGLEDVDEKDGEATFSLSGRDPKLDPYYIQYFRARLDGGDLTSLTPGDGTHTIAFSPDRTLYTDSYSRVDMPPIHELRRASDGAKLCELCRADVTAYRKTGIRMPIRFSAPGRDGKTPIYGIVCTPSNFDRRKKYPVIENIYAGPQDSFVPKAFSNLLGMQELAELGFIVVQIDGMGTANRSKAFHDVCWHDLADAGFPDRIAWMRALARTMPQADIDRVGVYGTSAGGQNAADAVLLHPEFYKVSVACAGCYDNRIDKQWWNEQWMGYPVGPWYAEQATAAHAAALRGRLLLMVGEDDHNVPPESTLRLVDALIKANKDFDYLMLPGFDHTDGGPYGEHKRRDFFVKWLLGVDPPAWG